MIKINGNTYKNAKLDLEAVCEFEEMGISLNEFGKKKLSVARAYLALCMNSSVSEANKELEQHMISGGTIKEIFEAFSDEVEKSDFFRSLKEKQETEDAKGEEQEAETLTDEKQKTLKGKKQETT